MASKRCKQKKSFEGKPHSTSRRRFMKQAAGALAGGYLGFYVPKYFRMAPSAGPTSNMQFRTMGRTGLKVSEIGFGGYAVRDPNVVEYAIDQGINYIDTAWDYTNGLSEETIGRAISRRRDEVVLTTKWHPWKDTKASEMMRQLNTSLRRLRTDHVDFLLVHQVGKVSGGQGIERIQNPELAKAIAMAKRQGKARYFGLSGHDPDLMEIMHSAIEMPDVDLILCRYNFKTYPTEGALFKKAKEKGIGVVAMKTLAGARGERLESYTAPNTTYRQAALKWVLSNQNVSNLIISISSKQQVDEFVLASGYGMAPSESRGLS